jgi:hypothetical protein
MTAEPTILNIRMVPAGLELVIAALRRLPHDQVDALVRELHEQYQLELARQQIAAQEED